MTEKELPSPDLLRKLLRYEPKTGKLFWKERGSELFESVTHQKIWNTRYANTEAFLQTNDAGYRVGAIFGVIYRAHRVIWAIQKLKWPIDQIDHIDRDRTNNKWENLRQATSSQNASNVTAKASKASKYLGVYRPSGSSKWQAKIKKFGQVKHLGMFVSEVAAAKAYDRAARKYHGEFANLNFPDLQGRMVRGGL